jgi:hypothetical protein
MEQFKIYIKIKLSAKFFKFKMIKNSAKENPYDL